MNEEQQDSRKDLPLLQMDPAQEYNYTNLVKRVNSTQSNSTSSTRGSSTPMGQQYLEYLAEGKKHQDYYQEFSRSLNQTPTSQRQEECGRNSQKSFGSVPVTFASSSLKSQTNNNLQNNKNEFQKPPQNEQQEQQPDDRSKICEIVKNLEDRLLTTQSNPEGQYVRIDLLIVLKRVQHIALEIRKKESEEINILRCYQDELLFLLDLLKAETWMAAYMDQIFVVIRQKIEELQHSNSVSSSSSSSYKKIAKLFQKQPVVTEVNKMQHLKQLLSTTIENSYQPKMEQVPASTTAKSSFLKHQQQQQQLYSQLKISSKQQQQQQQSLQKTTTTIMTSMDGLDKKKSLLEVQLQQTKPVSVVEESSNSNSSTLNNYQFHKRTSSLPINFNLIQRLESEESENEQNEPPNKNCQQQFFVQSSGDLNRKQNFYSQCLNVKMKLPKMHKGVNIPISSIYEKMVKENIPEREWVSFIQSVYDNCK